MIYGGNVIDTRLSLHFNFDLFYLTAAYGLTDNIDVSMALTINRAGALRQRRRDDASTRPAMRAAVGVFTPDATGRHHQRHAAVSARRPSAARRTRSTAAPSAPATSSCAASGISSTRATPTSPSPAC